MEVSAMASALAVPREGYLKEVFKMFSFLNSKHNRVTVFGPAESGIYKTRFPT